MTFAFRPAVREQTSLLIGIAGPSGAGKTMSALRLATGLAGGGKIAMVDTEAGRGLHYSGMFAFDHADLKPPFRPDAYVEAIKAADAAGYKVIIVDSTSHEWAGEGGILDWHEEEMQRMAGDDWKRREAVKMAAWIKPKMGHKHMVQAVLQVRASIIFCLRAEEKVAMVKDDKGKTQIVPQGFQPICAKDFMYEMTVSMLLLPTAPGIPQPIKLQQQHAHTFPAGRPVSEETGRLLGEWANGGQAPTRAATETPLQAAEKAAGEGTEALRRWWSGEGRPHQAALAGDLARLKERAAQADPKPEGGESGKPQPSVNESRRDKIMAMFDEAGDSEAAIDSVIRSMGGVLKKMNEEAPDLYDAVMKSAQERKRW